MNIKLIEKELIKIFYEPRVFSGQEIVDLIEEYFNALKHDKE